MGIACAPGYCSCVSVCDCRCAPQSQLLTNHTNISMDSVAGPIVPENGHVHPWASSLGLSIKERAAQNIHFSTSLHLLGLSCLHPSKFNPRCNILWLHGIPQGATPGINTCRCTRILYRYLKQLSKSVAAHV